MIYVTDKDLKVIKTKLSKDMDSIADWFDKNGLIINLEKSKTEGISSLRNFAKDCKTE